MVFNPLKAKNIARPLNINPIINIKVVENVIFVMKDGVIYKNSI